MSQNTVHRINRKSRLRCTQTVIEIPLEFQGFSVSCFRNISELQTRLAALGITGEILEEKKNNTTLYPPSNMFENEIEKEHITDQTPETALSR